jgi:hypothetical protein
MSGENHPAPTAPLLLPVRALPGWLRALAGQAMLALLVIAVLSLAVSHFTTPSGAPASAFAADAGVTTKMRVVDRVPIQTQIDPTIGYDSPAQFKAFSDASCSAASSSSVLLAWGDPNGRIGRVIDDMAPDLTTAGLQNIDGFRLVGEKHGFNVVISHDITAAQIAELVTVPGIPVIVGIKDHSNDYYRYFAPGHYLVIVGADPNGFKVVDNSTYFVHYLPTNTFMQLWNQRRTIIFTPRNYTLPIVISSNHP